MAALVLGLIPLGVLAANWPLSRTKLELFFWHKSLGLLVAGMLIVRLAWRLLDRPPLPPATASAMERILARGVHWALYATLFTLPLSGWIINSAANFPFKVFGWFRLPALVPADKATQTLAETAHLTLAILLACLLALHIGAALHHHRVRRNDTLRRMWPARSSRAEPGRVARRTR